MGLLEDLATAQNAGFGPRCKFCKWVDGLEDELQAAVVAAVTSDELQASTLARLFRKYGFDGGDQTVAVHRRDPCKQWRHERTG